MAARMLILACAMWGLSFPVIKALSLVQTATLPGAGTWLLSAVTMVWRFALAAAFTALIAVARTGGLRITRSEFAQGLGLGVFGGLGMLLQVDGLSHTEASTSAFLTQGTVVFIPLFKMLARPGSPPRARRCVARSRSRGSRCLQRWTGRAFTSVAANGRHSWQRCSSPGRSFGSSGPRFKATTPCAPRS